MIYLDNSATTQTLGEAATTAFEAMTQDYYNPAGAYKAAARVEKRVEQARSTIASTLKVSPSEIIFTSGGTESNNMSVFGTLKNVRSRCRIITTAVEHPSVYEVFRSLEGSPNFEVVIVPVDKRGHVDIDALEASLTTDTAFVSIMHINNELGTITDLNTVSALVRKKSPAAILHSDGVQAYMKQPLMRLPVDMYSASGHKFHAPKGVGFLYVNAAVKFSGGQLGGGQEGNLRSGTTNVPSILAMETAIDIYSKNMASWHSSMRACKKRLYQNLKSLPNVFVNGPSVDEGADHILNLSFDGVRGEVLLHALEQKDICVSTGSACSSHKKGKNRILTVVGITGSRQEGAIRFSFCPFNTLNEMDSVSEAIFEQVTLLRRYRRR